MHLLGQQRVRLASEVLEKVPPLLHRLLPKR